jgi:glycosyltransferase involved in cell wall biosynthesis
MRPIPGTPLRIAMVAPLWAAIPPATYGGTELIVHLLTEELVERGHEVTLFAAGNSRTRANLRSVTPGTAIEAMARGDAYEYVHYANALFAETLRDAAAFDVIHCHLGCAYLAPGMLATTPVLHTPHTVLSRDDLWAVQRYPQAAMTAISHHQAAAIPWERRAQVRVIHHGIDFAAYRFTPMPGQYLAFLGRMGPQKSPSSAIEVARRAGMPLILAGRPQNAEEEAYFAEQVRPLIDGKNIRYIGPVNHREKNELLGGAAALLFPIQGEEAFGLAMIEAMACGTPVVAWQHSSVTEVIEAGTTGFFGTSIADLAHLVPLALALDRGAVHAQARRRFSHLRMVDDYLEQYVRLTRQPR